MLNSVGKIAKPVAIATDVVRVANAVHQDDGTIGKNTMLTSASVAGGWAGAAIGGIIGSLFAGWVQYLALPSVDLLVVLLVV